MKKFNLTALMVLVFCLVLTFDALWAQEAEKIDWNAYSKNLVMAVKSNNDGLKYSAMQQIIRYAENLNVSQARYEIMDVFLKSENIKVRQLALVALSKINHPLDLGLLERQINFEENEVVKKQIAAVLVESGRMPEFYQQNSTQFASAK